MRRALIGLAVVVGVSIFAPSVRAQNTGIFSDPFSAYYGYYLPRQAAMALGPPNSTDVIRQLAAERQGTPIGDRFGGQGQDEIDPFNINDDFFNNPSTANGGRRGRSIRRSMPAVTNTNLQGAGPQQYFNRYVVQTASNRSANAYPTHRVGRGPNQNTVQGRRASGRSTATFGGAMGATFGGFR